MTGPIGVYEFGPYRLDVPARVLSLRGRPLALPPKPFDLLLLLIERRGRVLERDELIRALWPDTVVEEANLTFQVSTLRKALGEDGAKWIETVPKHGYRFSAPVRETATDGGSTADGPAAVARTRRGWPLLAAVSAAVVALAGFGLWTWSIRSGRSAPTPSTTAVPLTAYPGSESYPT